MSDIDDLDDYLNDEPELPSLQDLDNELSEKEKHNTGTSSDQNSKSRVTDEKETSDNTTTEVDVNQTNEGMNSLEQEFNKVFLKNQSHTNDSNTAASEFQELLQMLSAASMAPSTATTTTTTTTTSINNTNSTDFKDIVSSTLGRLKENNSKLDQDLKSEQQQQQHTTAKSSDDILAQLLDQLVNEDNTGNDNNDESGAGTMDNAILNMLDQMCTKEVLYPSMQEMKTNFELWFQNNSEQSTGEADWLRYTKQRNTIVEIVKIYELPEYSNKTHVSQITDLLDQLEELGDTPAEVANSSSSSNPTGNNNTNNNSGIPQGLNLDEKALENLDQELQDNCKQQ